VASATPEPLSPLALPRGNVRIVMGGLLTLVLLAAPTRGSWPPPGDGGSPGHCSWPGRSCAGPARAWTSWVVPRRAGSARRRPSGHEWRASSELVG